MIRRFSLILLVAALPGFSQVAVKTAALKNADGTPDLQGVWSTSTTVPLERPANLGAKEFYTQEEVAANAARAAQRRGNAAPAEEGALAVHYDLSQFGLDKRETAPSLRTSLIVGPEGRIPPTTDEAKKRAAARTAFQREHGFNGPKPLGLANRCTLWGGEGPPMLSPGYNSELQ